MMLQLLPVHVPERNSLKKRLSTITPQIKAYRWRWQGG